MFRRTNEIDAASPSQEISLLLQKGCYLEGKLHFEGVGRIDGNFKGEIFTPDILIIGDEAEVTGKVEADVVIIAGKFQGDILALQRVEIRPPAIVKGTIKTVVLQIEEGAIFDGQTAMLKFPLKEN